MKSVHHTHITMESFRNGNYLSFNPKIWVELLNLSTQEWGLGYLPAGVIAIPGEWNETAYENLNSTGPIPDDAIVIEDASKAEFGSRDIEKIIFGTASGIVILWAIIWLWINRSKLKKLRNTGPVTDDASLGTSATLGGGVRDENFVTAIYFHEQLRDFYYDGNKSHLEMREKDFKDEDVDPNDIEAATALVRKMYSVDSELWASHDTRDFTQAQRNDLMTQSDAILTEINRLVAAWDDNLKAPRVTETTPRETKEMADIIQILRAIGPERYPYKNQRLSTVNGNQRRPRGGR